MNCQLSTVNFQIKLKFDNAELTIDISIGRLCGNGVNFLDFSTLVVVERPREAD